MHLLDAQRGDDLAGPAQSQPNPARIFDTLLYSYARAEALKAAIELDLFTAIAEGSRDPVSLAERCAAASRGIRTLCDFLVVNGFLTKTGGEYALTPDTRTFLDKHSPAYLGSVAQFMAHRHNAERSATLLESVRKGSCVRDVVDDVDDWVTFAHAMLPLAAPVAAAVAGALNARDAGPMSVLDVAASHGEFGLAVARANPQAHIVGLDFERVIAVGAQRARAEGLDSRYSTIAGSAFDVDLGGPYDVVLLPNFLHHFELRKVQAFMRKVAGALKPKGRVAIVDFVPNEDRVTPPWPAMFSMTMLTATTGDAYTLREFEDVLKHAGFADLRVFPAAPSPQTIIIAHRT
ncbi:MAG: methyltransferase [Candidatus Velthaea sp.]